MLEARVPKKETKQMKTQNPAARALALAAALVLSTAGFAAAEDAAASAAAAPAEEAAPAKPFKPTIYVGPAFGYAKRDSSDYAWQMQVLARFFRYGGVQLEYFDGGTSGLYIGAMPILPICETGASLYAQLGSAFVDGDIGVAAGTGAMYDLPIPFLEKNNVDLTFRLDYKYLDILHGEHMLTAGFMFGFHK
jgi:hypothetical protein